MNKIDITTSMLIDNAVLRYKNTTEEILKELGIPYEYAEIALEKALFELKEQKLRLYASATYECFKELKERKVENGDKDD